MMMRLASAARSVSPWSWSKPVFLLPRSRKDSFDSPWVGPAPKRPVLTGGPSDNGSRDAASRALVYWQEQESDLRAEIESGKLGLVQVGQLRARLFGVVATIEHWRSVLASRL